MIGPLLTAKPADRPARAVAVQLAHPELSTPCLHVWAGGVRVLGTALAIVPGRTTDDPQVLRDHAAAVLAAAELIEQGSC